MIWNRINSGINYSTMHEMIGDMSGYMINQVLKKDSSDNLTLVFIALSGIKSHFNNSEIIHHTAATAQQAKVPKILMSKNARLEKEDEKNTVVNVNISKISDFNEESKRQKAFCVNNNEYNNFTTNQNQNQVLFTPKLEVSNTTTNQNSTSKFQIEEITSSRNQNNHHNINYNNFRNPKNSHDLNENEKEVEGEERVKEDPYLFSFSK